MEDEAAAHHAVRVGMTGALQQNRRFDRAGAHDHERRTDLEIARLNAVRLRSGPGRPDARVRADRLELARTPLEVQLLNFTMVD